MLNKFKNNLYRLLLLMEKWTKTDMLYLAKGSFWLSIGQFFTILSSFLLSVAFANFLPQETYGTYKYLLSIISLLSIPCLSAMHSAITKAVANGNEGTIVPALYAKMKWGSIGSIASLALAIYYFSNLNNTIAICLLITAFFIPFYSTFTIYAALLSGRKNWKSSTTLQTVSQLLIAIITIITIFYTDNIVFIFLSYFSSRTIINYAIFKWTLFKYKPNNKIDKESIVYGIHLSLMGVITTVSENIDSLIIWHYVGSVELAIFAIAIAPVNQMRSLVLKNVANLAFPKFSENTFANLKRTLPIKIAKLTIFSSTLAAAYFLMAPIIFRLFFPNYLEAIPLTQILIITVAIVPLGLFSVAFMSQGKSKILYFLSATTSIIKILLYIILLPKFGIYGIVYAFVGAIIFENILQMIFFIKK